MLRSSLALISGDGKELDDRFRQTGRVFDLQHVLS